MKYVDEFRDPVPGRKLGKRIKAQVARILAARDGDDPLKVMEVCGGHTHAIFKFGLEGVLPEGLELVHGPGCPVCVLPVGRVDDALAIAETPGVILTTFGDTLRVPGSERSLLQAKAAGADVRTVYSPADALDLARREPTRQVVFFALGFETTVPSTALTILQADAEGVENFSIFSNHITIPETMRALLESADLDLAGFIGPGHVSMVIGLEAYDFVANEFGKPIVVSGFEPLDILLSLTMVLAQIEAGEAKVENQYSRIVRREGNRVAQEAIQRVFELRPHFEWRGLGSIPRSGLRLTEAFARFDAESRFEVPALSVADPKAFQCGDVLKGVIRPWQCKVFGTACTPETPIGACMVSSEGACSAYYNYGRLSTLPVV